MFRWCRSRDSRQENNPVAALSEMMDMIDASPKTVVAALNGPALGGGCDPWNGIIDAVANKDVIEEGASAAVVEKRPELSVVAFMVAAGGLESGLNTAVNAAPLMIAPRRGAGRWSIIKCFEAACSNKSFREGLQVESAALRHLFLSERLAQKVPGVDEKPLPLKKIGILGAGLMGGGIAMCFIQKGVPVVLKDAKQAPTPGCSEQALERLTCDLSTKEVNNEEDVT
eukprot:Skav207031  [mRNA]  locus=scaffold1828:67238:75583:- [translate_table: standard]